MIILSFMACLETVPQETSPQLALCDRLSLRQQQCGVNFTDENIQSRCQFFPLQRVEMQGCLDKQCNEFSACLTALKSNGWTPESDPGFCEAFRLKKMSLGFLLAEQVKKNPKMEPQMRSIFWVAGAECETDNSMALKCYAKNGEAMLNCILNSSDLLPTLSVSSEFK